MPDPAPRTHEYALDASMMDMLFRQSLAGIFFMMLDEPVAWNDGTDKDRALDYVFEHQRITGVNPAMLAQYRATPDQLVGATPAMMFAHDISQGKRVWREFFDRGQLHVDTSEQRMDGTFMAVLGDYICMYDDAGRISGHFGIQMDVTEARAAEEKVRVALADLAESEARYRLIADNVFDVVGIVDPETEMYRYVSPSVLAQTGYTQDETMHLRLEALMVPTSMKLLREVFSEARDFLAANPDDTYRRTVELQKIRKDDETLWVEMALSMHRSKEGRLEAVGVSRSIEERKHAEALRVLSYHDQLTGLYNRFFYDTIVQQEMERSDRYNSPLAMAIFDLDLFKRVNDKWGHPAGDEVLRIVANTAASAIRATDFLVRLGGEEFVVLMPQTDLDGALVTAEKIRAALEAKPMPYCGTQTVSIGVGERMRGESGTHWYRRVDFALYDAKLAGRNCVKAVVPEENRGTCLVNLPWRMEWESGDATIDAQHLRIHDLSNILVDLAMQGAPRERILEGLDRLLDQVATHFDDEEKIIAKAGFPDYRQHAGYHRKLLTKASRLRAACEIGEVKPAAFFSFVLDDVLIGHLDAADTKYFSYTRAKNAV